MLFDISDLDPAGVWLDVEVDVPDYEDGAGETIRTGRATLSAQLRKTRRGIELKGRFGARVQLPCSRCLESLEMPVEGEVRLFLRPGGSAADAFQALDDDDPDAVDLYPLEASTVDLGELVREQVDLALPYQVFCEDLERPCRGRDIIREDAGEESVDERWGELKRLRESLGKKKRDESSS